MKTARPTRKNARFWFHYYYRRMRQRGYSSVKPCAAWQDYYVFCAKRSFEGCDRLAIRNFYRSPTALKYALRWNSFRVLPACRLPR